MTTERRAKTPFSGKGICRWCGKPVVKPRLSWCSDACVQEYLLRSDPVRMRAHVLERDKGVCARCGVDCLMLEEYGRRLIEAATTYRISKPYQRARAEHWKAVLLGYYSALEDIGFNVPLGTFWEGNHILPVVEGGGGCGPENIETLCQPCHKQETRALARRRAEQRRAKKTETQHELPLAVAGGGGE